MTQRVTRVILNASSCPLSHLHFVSCGVGTKPCDEEGGRHLKAELEGGLGHSRVWRRLVPDLAANRLQDSEGELTHPTGSIHSSGY